MAKKKRFVVDNSGEKYPFSKGVLVRSLIKTGLSVEDAYKVADSVASKFKGTISINELVDLVYSVLKKKFGKKVANKYRLLVKERQILVCEECGKTFVPFSRGILAGSITAELLEKKLGKEFSKRYLLWRKAKKLEKPIIILIGGATGVGKSKLASELSRILEINRTASTDSIREVMRKMVSKDLVPSIHVSSYEAGEFLPQLPETKRGERIIYGFLDQSEKVLTGVNAIINRAIKENVSLIVEGIHLIPGFAEKFKDKAHIVHIVLSTLDEEIHKSRFKSREKSSQRTSKKYLKNFKAIRKIQDFLYGEAKEKGIPVVENIDFDETRNRVLNVVTEKLLEEIEV